MTSKEGSAEQRRIQARANAIRAARRKKILENANSRMEKVFSVQQRSSSAEHEGKREKEKTVEVGVEVRERAEMNGSHEQSPVEDPPDELVVLAPQLPQKPKLVPSQSRSLLMRWKAVMCDSGLHCTRLGLATITGMSAAVIMGYSIPSLLLLVTSELCLLLWTLVTALTRREFPSQPQTVGTMGMVKVAIRLLYPPVITVLDDIQHVVLLVGTVCEDLCVSLFVFVTATALLHLALPEKIHHIYSTVNH